MSVSAVAREGVAVMMVPGTVLGESDIGLVNFVGQLDEIQRGEVAGYNSRVIGGYRQLFPRLSKLDYEQLKLTELPEVKGALEAMISTVHHLTVAERNAYMRSRKIVRQSMPDGNARLIMVPRVGPAATEIDILQQEADGFVEAPFVRDVGKREKSRKYTLAQILSDTYVLSKYKLPMRSVETAKRVAATDPDASAALFQGLMNGAQDGVAVSVTAGDYSRNRVQAKNAIRQICKGAPRTDVAVHSIVAMDEFNMYGPEGEQGWFVTGPLKYATEISYVYWMVRSEGCIMPSLLLAMELVLLQINIHDGFTAQEPELSYHAADEDVAMPMPGLAEATSSALTAEGRVALLGLADRLLPVLGDDGKQLATAVRVSEKYVLVNSHVMEVDAAATVGGQRIEVRSQLSRDLWSAKLRGDSAPWLLREPIEGEMVVICCSVDGAVSCSPPLQVTSVDASCVVTTKHGSVTFGASGGAVVALSDFALLGVHSASTISNLLSYRFGPREFSDLLEADSVSTFSRQDDVGSFAHATVEKFKRRGLWSVFKTAVDSMEPVYVDNVHIGMAVSNGRHTYTTCDPGGALRIGESRRTAVFETAEKGLYRTVERSVKPTPVYRRTPVYFERVFVLGFDDQAYISAESHVVHVGLDSRSFVIADLPSLDKSVRGGIVMAGDGAMLGCCGERSMTTPVGMGYHCYPVPREASGAEDVTPKALLATAFPFLNLPAWPDKLVEEVFTHSSVGKYSDDRRFNVGMRPLANVGDNIAKAYLYKSLREVGMPHSQWAGIMQSVQSNAAYARVAHDFGYAPAMRVGSGIVMPKEAKGYADLTEALLGAAFLVEEPENVELLCKAMKIVYSE